MGDMGKNYFVMHMETEVAEITSGGQVRLINERFLPYDLYLEADDDIDTRLNNLNNFYHWCASRMLPLDRKYAKDILASIGASQMITDRERAAIALTYRCVSLTDVFWVKESEENISYEEINLYDHPLNEAIVELSLKGRQMTVTNDELAPDLSTRGCFPKAWVRREEGFVLLKDGGDKAVKRELLASAICQCFDFPQVNYEKGFYDGEPVTKSHLVTSKRFSMVSKMAFDIYAANRELDTLEECIKVDAVTYYGMNMVDYLVGNTDRHPENWGFLIDNRTNEAISLYPLMDFNQSFYQYHTLEGAVCQTVFPRKMNQMEAAVEAVKKIGFRQKKGIPMELFEDAAEWKDMFCQRYKVLKEAARKEGI